MLIYFPDTIESLIFMFIITILFIVGFLVWVPKINEEYAKEIIQEFQMTDEQNKEFRNVCDSENYSYYDEHASELTFIFHAREDVLNLCEKHSISMNYSINKIKSEKDFVSNINTEIRSSVEHLDIKNSFSDYDKINLTMMYTDIIARLNRNIREGIYLSNLLQQCRDILIKLETNNIENINFYIS